MNSILIQLLLIAAACLSLVFVIYNFMERMFARAYPTKVLYAAAFLLSWLLMFGANLLFSGIASMIASFTIVLVTGLWLYGVRRSSDLLTLLLFYIFLLLTEVIGQISVSIITGDAFSIMPGDLLQSLITFLCYQVMMFFLTRSRRPFHQPGYMGVLLAVPVMSVIVLYILMALLPAGAGPVHLALSGWGALLLFAINILVYYLFGRMAALSAEKQQYAIMEQQRQMQFRNYQELARKNEEARRLYHDLKKHIRTLEQLYRGEHDSSAAYETELLKRASQLHADFSPTGNRVFDSLVQTARERAAETGVLFSYSTEPCDLSFLSDFDLTTILANLLDNAFEACAPGDTISLHLTTLNCFTLLSVSNPSEAEPVRHDGRYLSQKAGHMGVGLANVERAVEQYGSSLMVEHKESVFVVQAVFPGQDNPK